MGGSNMHWWYSDKWDVGVGIIHPKETTSPPRYVFTPFELTVTHFLDEAEEPVVSGLNLIFFGLVFRVAYTHD